MPELPEVETIKQTLQPKLAGRKFADVQIFLPKIILAPGPEEFMKKLIDRKIVKVNRRGKYLLINLDNEYNLVIHLRMTGRIVYCPPDEPISKHTHLIFNLDNDCQLRFADTRQFGRIGLVPTASLDCLAGYKNLGVEPLDETFTKDFLRKELKHRHARIKPLLLDQTFIAGLGNIYTDEVLHRAKINPERLAATLTPRETTRLYHAIREVIQEGIDNRGTTIRDFIDGDGRAGSYQELLQVYNREGKPCYHCGQNIVRKKVGGRSTFYCPSCQKT